VHEQTEARGGGMTILAPSRDASETRGAPRARSSALASKVGGGAGWPLWRRRKERRR
jgi:hypothetical protein